MQDVLAFLIANGHAVVFVWVLIAQAGVPVPVVPLLLAAGALAGAGSLDLLALLALSVAACLIGDGLWYMLGRRYGGGVLRLLCRISLEPDTCVKRTQGLFERRGAAALVFGKFVPGFSTVAPPLAGLVRMPAARFAGWSTVAALVWSAAWLVPGWLFHDQLERIASAVAATSTGVLVTFVAIVAGWIVLRWLRWRWFLRHLRIARVQPLELRRLQTEGVPVFVVDLRHVADFAADPHVVPGALRLDAEHVATRHEEIPRDRDVVLYCT